MEYEDKNLQCADCGNEFVFTAEEQQFFHSKGYTNEPKRCPSCRQERKTRRNESGMYRPQRQMFPAVCDECGKETEVPFEPSGNRPVYCSDCYRKIRQTS